MISRNGTRILGNLPIRGGEPLLLPAPFFFLLHLSFSFPKKKGDQEFLLPFHTRAVTRLWPCSYSKIK